MTAGTFKRRENQRQTSWLEGEEFVIVAGYISCTINTALYRSSHRNHLIVRSSPQASSCNDTYCNHKFFVYSHPLPGRLIFFKISNFVSFVSKKRKASSMLEVRQNAFQKWCKHLPEYFMKKTVMSGLWWTDNEEIAADLQNQRFKSQVFVKRLGRVSGTRICPEYILFLNKAN